jgi:hypothetical protein
MSSQDGTTGRKCHNGADLFDSLEDTLKTIVLCALALGTAAFSQNADADRGKKEILGFVGTAVDTSSILGTAAEVGGGVEAAYYVRRYLALTGNYAFDRIGIDPFCVFGPCGPFPDENIHEFMGGARVSLPGHRAEPYLAATIGGLRLTNINGVTSNQSTNFGYAVGVGVNIGITHRTGVDLDLRGLDAVSSKVWFVRPSVGFFFRF